MCKCQRDRYKDPATENEKVINLREEVIKRLEQTVGNDQFLRNEPMKKHITFRRRTGSMFSDAIHKRTD